jgi:hypothetical protein
LHGVFLLVFLPVMISACFGLAAVLSPLTTWNKAGPLLLFLGFFTLLNAPFDWASLGLTRALLRRGLELGGWWPYLLALVDAALAGVIIAALALVMVIGVQAFDELAVHGGGEPVLPLDTLFDGIANNPAAPEYWWAYALLLSSMIPSLVNLAIGGMAFTRGIPWLARLILNWIPEGKAVPEYKRQPAAIGLMVQMFAGAGRLGPHFPCHAVDRSRLARNGPGRRHIRCADATLADFRAHIVVDRFDGRAASAYLALRAEFFARRWLARHFSFFLDRGRVRRYFGANSALVSTSIIENSEPNFRKGSRLCKNADA